MRWSPHVRLGLPQTEAGGASPTVGLDSVPRLLLSITEVARTLGISVRFAKNLISSGDLPSLTIGRLRRVYLGDLLTWIELQRGRPLDRIGDETAHLSAETRRSRLDTRTGRSANHARRAPE
jgi:excisionase family DNA binding protein